MNYHILFIEKSNVGDGRIRAFGTGGAPMSV